MEKFVPYEKLSKKARRAQNARRRETWSISPVTRRPKNPRAYNRRKAQKWNDDSVSVPFGFKQMQLPQTAAVSGTQAPWKWPSPSELSAQITSRRCPTPASSGLSR